MKCIVLLLFCAPFFAAGQEKMLLIQGSSSSWYLDHTVSAKENYYSIGRMYNISPKEIAPYNNLQLEKGLSLNQPVKIPLTAGNFVQVNKAAPDEALVPVYYTVKEKEGLYRIAATYNKIPLETLKQWNHITGDAVGNGTNLIIGFLKVKKELSALAGMSTKAAENPVAVKEQAAPPEAVKNIGEEAKQLSAKAEKKKDLPAIIKKEKKPAEETGEAKMPARKDPPTITANEPAPGSNDVHSGKGFNGGFFKKDFNKQGADAVSETGTAALFKSTSGWEDGKYYCLHNVASAGTVIKVTNTATGKTIYAKVLDVIPDIQQNSGLLLRISNAAASELGAGENKFDCTVSFSK